MVTSWIISYGGVALVVWALLYSLDYYLTIYGARLYRQTASQIIVLEGSYELTPMFQEDVDRLRLFSKQFYARLIAGVIALFAFWLLATRTVIPVETFALLVGALVLREAPIMLRHARNITLFRAMRAPGAVQGHYTQARWLSLHISAVELFGFAMLYACLALIADPWFWGGGAIGCLAAAITYWNLGRRARST